MLDFFEPPHTVAGHTGIRCACGVAYRDQGTWGSSTAKLPPGAMHHTRASAHRVSGTHTAIACCSMLLILNKFKIMQGMDMLTVTACDRTSTRAQVCKARREWIANCICNVCRWNNYCIMLNWHWRSSVISHLHERFAHTIDSFRAYFYPGCSHVLSQCVPYNLFANHGAKLSNNATRRS